MKTKVSGMVHAPTTSPCLEQIAWGMISPKMTIASVEATTA